MRTIAVVAVVLYHARLGPFDGGYVGVDVFFVVSGFLITRLLLSEVERTGTISLPSFWARRARRLLPASAVVIITTLFASRVILDPLTQGFVNRSGLAASTFVANILFWTRGGYSQLTLPEPLLHFWSLAVEEQFYLFWPLVLVGLVRLRGHIRRLAATVTILAGIASFLACIALTPSRQPFAFYWLPTRAWELLAGAGLAIAGARIVSGDPRVRGALGWLGLAGIAVCLVTYPDPQYGFPGFKALGPVLATVLVIVGGAHAPSGPGRLLGTAPMLWIGQRSYAIYLWHFPFIVLAEAEWGPLSTAQRVGVVALSVVVAAASFAWLEDPVRRSRWLAEVPSRSLRLGGLLTGASALTAIVLLQLPAALDSGTAAQAPTIVVDDSAADPQVDEQVPLDSVAATDVPDDSVATDEVTDTSEPDPTAPDAQGAGASAEDPDGDGVPTNPARLVRLAEANADLLAEAVENDLVPSNLEPALRDAYDDKPGIYDDGCILGGNETEPGECTYGNAGSDTTVVLFGDSHAAQWFPAFERVAERNGWRLVMMVKQACPTGDIQLQIAGQTGECRRWRANVLERMKELEPDLMVFASFRYKGSSTGAWKAGLDETLADFRPVTREVLLLGDTPTPKGDVPSCVAARTKSLTRCNTARSDAVKPHWLAVDAALADKYEGRFVSTSDWLCTDEACPTVIGNVLVYRDESHLTTAAAEFLTPYVERMLEGIL